MKRMLMVLCVLALALAAVGCAPPEEPVEPVEPVEPEEPLEPEEPVEEVITPNTAVHAVQGEMPSLDPPYMLSADTNIGFNVYETLTLWLPDEGVVPVLAESWESNDDATEWTFNLRQGVTFHDGSEMMAHDVKASLDRNIDIGMVAYNFIGIESIEVVDDYTVRVLCSEPRDVPLVLSAGYGMFIYSAEGAERGTEWFAQGNDAGTGPYTIERYEPGHAIVVTRYEDYWGGWQDGQFTEVAFEMVEDPTVREAMIRGGDADITFGIPFTSIEGLQALDGLTVYPYEAFAHVVGAFALRNAPLDNVQVRQALAYSFPYEDVHEGVFLGYGSIPKGFGPTMLWDPPEGFPRYELDLDRAAELLDAAGYGDGFQLRLAVFVGQAQNIEAAELWQAQLAQIGVDLRIEQLSSGAFWDYAYTPEQDEFHIMMVTASGDVASPWSWLICYTSSPLGWLPLVGYDNPEFDSLVFDAWAKEATAPEEADELWVEAQRLLYEDAASIFIYDEPMVVAHGDDVVGFEPNPAYPTDVFWYNLRRE